MVASYRWLIVLLLPALAACDGRLVVAGNLTMAVVPCVLLWVTINLKKTR